MKHIKLPLVLFTDEKYKNLSVNAKVIYAFMLDRVSLSEKNGWQDENGRVYIIFTREKLSEITNLSLRSIYTYFCELKKAGLINSIHRVTGKPDVIYINLPADFADDNRQNLPMARAKFSGAGRQNLPTNQTNINQTYINQSSFDPVEAFWLNELEEYAKELRSESS